MEKKDFLHSVYNNITMTTIIEIAAAKINLTLDVFGKRLDGYHDVSMIMQSISLADKITLFKSQRIEMTCSNPRLPVDNRNLAFKAAELILDGSGYGVKIILEKNIPIEAGLAGGSSDAAAVLRGIDKLYELQKTREEMLGMAAKLGADVSFCLQGGTALAEGVGEKLTLLQALPKLWLVLIKPPYGVSTATIYQALRVENIKKHPDTEAMLKAIDQADRYKIIINLSNVLEEVTLLIKPEIQNIKNDLYEAGAENVLMSGSGPTVFGVFLSKEAADKAAEKIFIRHKEVYVAYTI